MLGVETGQVNEGGGDDSDSADPHLCIGWAADLTSVVGSEKLRGKLEWSGMAETVEKGLIFRRGRNTGTGRRGGRLKKMIGHVEGRARREVQLVLGESATNQ